MEINYTYELDHTYIKYRYLYTEPVRIEYTCVISLIKDKLLNEKELHSIYEFVSNSRTSNLLIKSSNYSDLELYDSKDTINTNINNILLKISNIQISNLTITYHKLNINTNNFPDTIRFLSLQSSTHFINYINNLPDNLEYLTILNCCRNSDNFLPFKLLNNLPSNLKLLNITLNKFIKIEIFPPNLEELYITPYASKNCFDLDTLPTGLKVLDISGIKYLDECPNLNNLPNTIKRLILYELKLESIPDSIEEIYIHSFSKYTKIDKISSNLKTIILIYPGLDYDLDYYLRLEINKFKLYLKNNNIILYEKNMEYKDKPKTYYSF
jgi:hypothetical protein